MVCPHCQAKWESRKPSSYCPFCGEDLRDPKEKAKESVSFDFTWGMMHEDSLKRCKGPVQPALRDQALECYMRSAAHQPDDALYIASFLERYPQSSAKLESLAAGLMSGDEPWSHLPAHQRLAISLLLQSSRKGSVRAALRLLHHLADQDGWSEEQKEALVRQLPFEGIQNSDAKTIEAAAQAFLHHGLEAGALLKQAYDPCELMVYSWKDLSAYSGILPEKERRVQQIQSILEKQPLDLDLLLIALYRPLEQEEEAFTHLSSVMEQVLPVLKQNRAEWHVKTKSLLEQKSLLRGIHLVLQQASNMDPQIEGLDDLLKLHYEKVYLQPYDWIRSTDFQLVDF